MSSSPSLASTAKRPGGCVHGPQPQPLIVPAEAASRPTKKPRVVAAAAGDPGPVIVYELTPRVVHARPEEFRAVVQKLTGKQSAAPPASAVTSHGQVAGGGGRREAETKTTAVAVAADPLVLALGKQRQPPAPPAIDDSSAAVPPPSPSSLFFSPTTMQALQELGVLF
ncbi:atherin-like [Oryza brachyantha]|uniref:atherin-like n=1 Tax=Oryza brachyantha TaxID=4533 RepID=UPI001ADD5110|nr:atherin-like [Oryza brachyantha]